MSIDIAGDHRDLFEEHEDPLYGTHPEWQGLGYRDRLAVLLDEAASRFGERNLGALNAMCRAASDELRRADSDDQFYRRLGSIGSGR